MSTATRPPRLNREGNRYIIAMSEEQVARRGLHEGQPVDVQPLSASRPSAFWSAFETVVDIVASKVALAQYRRYGKAVARDADDVLADLKL